MSVGRRWGRGPCLKLWAEVRDACRVVASVRPGHWAIVDGRLPKAGLRAVGSADAEVLSGWGAGSVGGRLVHAGITGCVYGGLVCRELMGREPGQLREELIGRPAVAGDLSKLWGGCPAVVVDALGLAGKGGTVVLSVAEGTEGTEGVAPADGWCFPAEARVSGDGTGGSVWVVGGAVTNEDGVLRALGQVKPGDILAAEWFDPRVKVAPGVVTWAYGRRRGWAEDLAVATGCGDWEMAGGVLLRSGGSYGHLEGGKGRRVVIGPCGSLESRRKRSEALLDVGPEGTVRAANMVDGVVVLSVPSGRGSVLGMSEAGDISLALARAQSCLQGGVVTVREAMAAGYLRQAGLGLGWLKRGWPRGTVVPGDGGDLLLSVDGVLDAQARVDGLARLIDSVGAVVSDRVPWVAYGKR